ncbi:MAG TPA: hypothetical protein VFT62_06575 [Mycobacteriales bacterium]|nr:hypothetical protein [Mycobacteriales bacterium]
MRTRMIIGGVLVAATAGLAIPALASSPTSSTGSTVPPACVVVTGPNGATVQVGYAPNGPADCQQLP